MEIIRDLSKALPDRESAVTIGAFDGVHLGHQRLLERLINRAQEKGWVSTVVTFSPHPREVLQPESSPAYLTTDAERAEILASLGIERLVLLRFDRALAETPARTFAQRLFEQLRMRELWIGPGFAFGKNREGDASALQRFGEELGFHVRIVEPFYANGEPISSTRIRQLLIQGLVEEAATLLGRPYTLEGIVQRGHARGRRLGFPTANLPLPPKRVIPANGVYAVWVHLDKESYPAVANIGIRPSFDAGERLLEVHVIGYQGDLYGQLMRVAFMHYLRQEQRFTDPAMLIAQIQEDIAKTLELLKSKAPRS